MNKIEDPANGPWHLDRRVPVVQIVTFVVAIIVQSFGIGVWVSSISARVTSLENVEVGRQVRLETWNNDRARLAVVESNLVEIKNSLTRIEDRIEGRTDK